jgi:hypothetical protein
VLRRWLRVCEQALKIRQRLGNFSMSHGLPVCGLRGRR